MFIAKYAVGEVYGRRELRDSEQRTHSLRTIYVFKSGCALYTSRRFRNIYGIILHHHDDKMSYVFPTYTCIYTCIVDSNKRRIEVHTI